MRKLLIVFGIMILAAINVYAAKVPDEVVEYINNTVPGTDIRFDSVVILPDNTIYLPLYPSLFSDIRKLHVKESIPANMDLNNKPDVIIFNNDFVLLKVINSSDGKKTVLHMANPPLQVRTGLLPQDMLVPSGLILPENLKGIIGNLNIDTQKEDIIKLTVRESFEEFLSENDKISNQSLVPELNGKTVYITTNYSKNIQVLEPAKALPSYSLAQKSIPVNAVPARNGKYLLVTSYERPFLDVVSIKDSRFIRQISLGTNPDEIVVDEEADKAYVTAPQSSVIFVIDLKTMSIMQKIRINGYCEKLTLSGDKIFYVDKMKGDIWSIETANNYTLKNIGNFPNVSAVVYANNKVYLSSRTKSRIAVVDYETCGLESEFTVSNKPTAMLLYNNVIYVLCAQSNIIQKINAASGFVMDKIQLTDGGFSSRFNLIDGTSLAVVADVKKNKYSIIDLAKGKLVKTYSVNIPVKDVRITDKVRLFD